MIYEIFKASLEFLSDVQGAFKLLLGFFNTVRYILGEINLEKLSSVMK